MIIFENIFSPFSNFLSLYLLAQIKFFKRYLTSKFFNMTAQWQSWRLTVPESLVRSLLQVDKMLD